ncbi:hypothetical protein MOO44_04975 [Nicoliella spurrieriana]|uniref:Uncharacterized protein n=1 Tax=Nicoliella spurrieriana TaxID=2925830 RepID=A0A976X4S5_9LACO|nr:hypothetical protein [Nicoliella spurrieriana]UQS86278.1 hypothetical protein MOO44_04975 [Nicoliella spurrieriana]
MGIVINNLKAAYNRGAVVNVYRVDDIIFTGYVYLLDENSEELVLRTYDEWGMPDGMVYLDLMVVYDVEVDNSQDLQLMKRRMDIAKHYHFKEIAETNLMPINKLANIRLEILGRSYVEGQMVMVTVEQPHGVPQSYKGLVNQVVSSEAVELITVDKTDFSSHHKTTIQIAEITTIEFLGKELTMLTKNRQLLFGDSVDQVEVAGDDPHILDLFADSKATHRLFEIESAANNGYYYIGYVVNYNYEYVIFNLVTMSGQFGGYVLMRNTMVARLFIDSDYLRLIKRFNQENRQADTFLEPVLNDEREFDMGADVLDALLEQAINLHQLVRIASRNAEGQLGYPVDMTPITKQVHFQPVDLDYTELDAKQAVAFNDIGELAFGYLEAFLVDDGLNFAKNQNH